MGWPSGPIRPSGSPLRRHRMARALTFNPSRLTARASLDPRREPLAGRAGAAGGEARLRRVVALQRDQRRDFFGPGPLECAALLEQRGVERARRGHDRAGRVAPASRLEPLDAAEQRPEVEITRFADAQAVRQPVVAAETS